jgi:hypothetical protein
LSKTIKRIKRPDPVIKIVVFILLVLTWAGCNTRIEGCLEANAENFDLNAERPCDGCCTYPSMSLSLTQKWNGDNFSNADTLMDANGQPFKIIDLKYFLSSWVWSNSEGALFTVDSVDAGCDESTLRFTTDNTVIDTRQFVYTLGTIRQSPLMDAVHFTFGLKQDFSCLDATDPNTPSSLTDQSPLWNEQSSTLETLRLIIQRSLDNETVDTVYINSLMDVRLDYALQLAPGIDTQLDLTVNYAQWFIDADVTDLSSFGTSINTNFAGSIIPTP